MKKLILIFSFLLISTSAFSQLRMYDNFDFPFGDTNTIYSNGWTLFSSTVNPIKIGTPGLTYAGYAYSGIGNAVKLDTTGMDAYKNFPMLIDSVNSSAAYMSFLISVQTAKPFGAYVAGMVDSTLTGGVPTGFRGRLYVKDSLGNVRFGVAKSAAGDTSVNVWSPNNYAYNTTYLIVIKFDFIPGPNNDAVSLFVFSSGVPAVEPVTPTLGPLLFSSIDGNTIKRALLRQGENTRGPRVTIDGIRISNDWMNPFKQISFGVQGLGDQGTSRLDTAQILVRNNTPPYAVVDQRVFNPYFTSGVATVSYESSLIGSYYLEIIYRLSAQFRNGINTYSALGGTPFDNSMYDFTSGTGQALGGNQISISGTAFSYNGDPSLDQYIDATDIVLVYNDLQAGATGYLNTDITGDDFVDVSDLVIVYNNSINGIGEVAP